MIPSEDQLYREHRARLFAIAYRMVGGVADAEDLVQEAFARYQRSGAEVEAPAAFLTTVVSRLAIDHLRSARVRREEYVGPWLPEPLLTESTSDVADDAERADSLSLAFMVVLDSLSPVERAVFLLHDVFGYGYDEVAEIVERTEANCRQLAVRARRHVSDRRPRFETSRAKREELAQRFVAACLEGETEPLVELLASDVVMYGDGGGKGPATPAPVRGRDKVLPFLLGLNRLTVKRELEVRRAEVNRQPGIVVLTKVGEVFAVVGLEIVGDQVAALHSIVNPDKLGHVVRQLASAARSRRP